MRPAPAKPILRRSAGTWRDTERLPCLACDSGSLHDGPCISDGMDGIAKMNSAKRDEHFLRRSFDVARRALTHGNHPFGAILVDGDNNVLIETENGYMPDHDGTAHAERLLATRACTTLGQDVLKDATLYSSAEPCAMCAGAIY